MSAYPNQVVKPALVSWKKCIFSIAKLILNQVVKNRRHIGKAHHHMRTTATLQYNATVVINVIVFSRRNTIVGKGGVTIIIRMIIIYYTINYCD